jgi:hypothetical protein
LFVAASDHGRGAGRSLEPVEARRHLLLTAGRRDGSDRALLGAGAIGPKPRAIELGVDPTFASGRQRARVFRSLAHRVVRREGG